MKQINRILLAVLVLSISTAYSQDSNSDNHQVSIVIPEISLLDIESAGSNDISLTMVAPGEAGETIADQTDNSLWLNVTCPPKVVPDCKLGYGKTIKEAGYVVSTIVRNRSSIN